MKITTVADLEPLRAAGLASLYPNRLKITVGMATCGRAAGADAVYEALQQRMNERGLDAIPATTGCIGYRQQEPPVDVRPAPGGFFARMTPGKARKLMDALADGGWPAQDALAAVREEEPREGVRTFGSPEPSQGLSFLDELPFYSRQRKIVLRNSGLIDPARLEEYVARGGYRALARALERAPQQVIDEVTRSGLRAGGGVPAGRKWQWRMTRRV
jgi:(2Fe-2S) ferredoxin